MDTTVERRGPKPGENRNAAVFYIIYFIFFPFFFLNIFVALIVVTFKDDEMLTGYDLDRNQVPPELLCVISYPVFKLHRIRMHDMQTIVTDVRSVCLSVCPSVTLSVTWLNSALLCGVMRCSLCQITLAFC